MTQFYRIKSGRLKRFLGKSAYIPVQGESARFSCVVRDVPKSFWYFEHQLYSECSIAKPFQICLQKLRGLNLGNLLYGDDGVASKALAFKYKSLSFGTSISLRMETARYGAFLQ
jgi:hypothetical protein